MPGVPCVLLEHVGDDATEAGRLGPGRTDGQPVQASFRQGSRGRCARADDRLPPRRHQLLGGVVSCALPFPVRMGFPVHLKPGRPELLPKQGLRDESSSTRARCLTSPPSVMVEGPRVFLMSADVSASHFQAKVRRFRSSPEKAGDLVSCDRERDLYSISVITHGARLSRIPGVLHP